MHYELCIIFSFRPFHRHLRFLHHPVLGLGQELGLALVPGLVLALEYRRRHLEYRLRQE